MKSLAYTLSQILDELPFGEGPKFEITINENFRDSLTDSLSLYASARTEALQALYKAKELIPDRPASDEADFEEVAASCGYFSFSLQDFAEEMQIFLETLDDLKSESESRNNRSWNWLKFWRVWNKEGMFFNSKFLHQLTRGAVHPDPERESLIDHNRDAGVPKHIPDIVMTRRDIGISSANESKRQSVYTRILKVVRFLRRDDSKFAFEISVKLLTQGQFDSRSK